MGRVRVDIWLFAVYFAATLSMRAVMIRYRKLFHSEKTVRPEKEFITRILFDQEV